MLYGHSSTERRTLSGFSAYRDPVEDSAWAQAFLNDFEAVEDEDGQRQVLTDYGHELTDPVRQDALRENLVGRLHRRAEIEKMDAREYMDRLSVLDSAPFGSKAHRQRRPGEYRVANAALLLGLMGSAGIAGAPLWAPVPGRIPGSLGRMTPPPVFGPYPGFPVDKQVKPDPFVLPIPDRREPPVYPGGTSSENPVDDENRTVSPDQSDEFRDTFWFSIEVPDGSGIKLNGTLGGKVKLGEFLEDTPSKSERDAISEIIDGSRVIMDERTRNNVVNIQKGGGLGQSQVNFDALRRRANVPLSEVRRSNKDTEVFRSSSGVNYALVPYKDGMLRPKIEIVIWVDSSGRTYSKKDNPPKLKIKYD